MPRVPSGDKQTNRETTEVQEPKQPYGNPQLRRPLRRRRRHLDGSWRRRSDLATISAHCIDTEGACTMLSSLAIVKCRLRSDMQTHGKLMHDRKPRFVHYGGNRRNPTSILERSGFCCTLCFEIRLPSSTISLADIGWRSIITLWKMA